MAMTDLTDVLGYIDQTLNSNEGGAYRWPNSEVMEALTEIRGMIVAAATELDLPVEGSPS